MQRVYLAKQKIFNAKNKIFANELLYRDYEYGIKEFPSNVTATSHVLINVLINVNEILNETGVVLVNVDEEFLLSGLVDLLDTKKFILEILETTDLNEEVISKIKQYHKRGFKIAIDDFDCSTQMIKKFTPIFKYIHLVKIDILNSQEENLAKTVEKFKKIGLRLLAEKIETKDEFEKCKSMGFDLFQGYYLGKPEVVEIDRGKDVTNYIILNLIKVLKTDGSTQAIESYIKQRPELSYKLIKFLNSQAKFETKIESIVQVITLLGRDKLLRWLLLYLYSEMSDNPVSETILAIALRRAENMERYAEPRDKDKAFTAGMFSMIGALFDMDNSDVVKGINLDKDILDIVVHKKGKYLRSLIESQRAEQAYLKQLFINNFEKIDIVDIIYTLDINGIKIDNNRF
jgi:EAL and modified HD-GYP domain-containing signal transduction protein